MKYTKVSDELYSYILSSSVKEEGCLKELREETLKFPFYGMQISQDQGQFLKLITKITNAKDILEIGSFTGYSALCFAVASMPEAKLYLVKIIKIGRLLQEKHGKNLAMEIKFALNLRLHRLALMN